MPKTSGSRRGSRSKTPKALLIKSGSVAGAVACGGSGAGTGTGGAQQTGGAPGSIASSPLIPTLTLKSFTDLFSTKSNFLTLQSPANNIMDSKVLTAAHNFFHNLNTSTFFAGFVMIILNIGSRYINLDLSSSTESWIKYLMSKEVLVFAVSLMGTRAVFIMRLLLLLALRS